MDKVRIWWEERSEVYYAMIITDGTSGIVFYNTDRAEFFRRYNAITVEKAPPEEA